MNGSLRIQPHVRSMIDADGAVLLDLKRGKYYSLNGVGAQIWIKAKEGRTLPEILNYLQESYPPPLNGFQQDLDNFVNGLQAKGLAHVSE